MHWVYILMCADGSYYVGETTDPEARARYHNQGRGGKHTAQRIPVRLLYSECLPTHEDALKRERQIERWSSAKKAALIAGDVEQLKHLSRRRVR